MYLKILCATQCWGSQNGDKYKIDPKVNEHHKASELLKEMEKQVQWNYGLNMTQMWG